MEIQLSVYSYYKYPSKVLTLRLVARIYNLTKFARIHKAQSGNMCKVNHPALSYVEVSSEYNVH